MNFGFYAFFFINTDQLKGQPNGLRYIWLSCTSMLYPVNIFKLYGKELKGLSIMNFDFNASFFINTDQIKGQPNGLRYSRLLCTSMLYPVNIFKLYGKELKGLSIMNFDFNASFFINTDQIKGQPNGLRYSRLLCTSTLYPVNIFKTTLIFLNNEIFRVKDIDILLEIVPKQLICFDICKF